MRVLPLLFFFVSIALPDARAQADEMVSSGYVLRHTGTTNGGSSSLSASYRLLGVVRGGGAARSLGGSYAVGDDGPLPVATSPGGCPGKVTIADVQQALNMFTGLTAASHCVDLDGNNVVSVTEMQKVLGGFLGW